MKYLRKFETEAEYKAFLASSEFINPNVSLVAGEVKYAPIIGVFIQHIDGTLYTTDEWTAGGFSNDVANGVAVAAPEASFVIAKTQISSGMAWSSDTSTLVEGVFTTTDKTTALTDYAGAANTALITAIDTSKAAYSCANYTFPNGQKGYLPALGEWVVAYNNKTAIDAAMTLIGGTAISSTHWSSTQYSAGSAWLLSWSSSNVFNGVKSAAANRVRAFSALTL